MNTYELIRKKNFLKLLVISISFLFSCGDDPNGPGNSGYQYEQPVETIDGWETATLSSVEMDPEPVENLVNAVEDFTYIEIHSVVIIKNDKLVFEHYWGGHDFGYASPNYLGGYLNFNMNTRHNTHSTTKSFTSAVVGIAIDKGYIGSEDDVIFDYLGEEYDTWKTGGKEYITIKDCLMMASGLDWNENDVSVSNNQNDMVRFNQSYDPIRYLLMKPLVGTPGVTYYYNGGTVDLLGVIVANATGRSIPEFSNENLFAPMGITNYNWQTLRPSGITCCHGDIYISPRDLAKFGYLFLNNGQWNGEQLVSTEWVEKSTQFHINPGVYWADGYGYLWWLRILRANGHTYHSLKTMGWGGQEIFVFRELNMVIVFTGANYVSDPPCDEIVENYILPALQ